MRSHRNVSMVELVRAFGARRRRTVGEGDLVIEIGAANLPIWTGVNAGFVAARTRSSRSRTMEPCSRRLGVDRRPALRLPLPPPKDGCRSPRGTPVVLNPRRDIEARRTP